MRKDRAFKSHADLKGMKIGVTAPGSSTHFFVLYLMAKAGLAPTDATFVGVGGGPAAVAAMKDGEIDAISNLDPVITRLQEDGAIRIVDGQPLSARELSDLRRHQSGGGALCQAGLHRREPEHDAGAGERVLQDAEMDRDGDDRRDRRHRVRTDYFLGDRAIYVKALQVNLLVYSKTGMITRQGMNSALNMLATFDPELKGAKIDLPKDFRRPLREAGDGPVRRSEQCRPGDGRAAARDRP